MQVTWRAFDERITAILCPGFTAKNVTARRTVYAGGYVERELEEALTDRMVTGTKQYLYDNSGTGLEKASKAMSRRQTN